MLTQRNQTFIAGGAGMAALVIGGLLFQVSSAQAQTPTFDLGKVQKGLAIAPVPLNLTNKDPNLVGYGSYLVNAVSDCNGCHSAGPPTQYAPGGNPYFGQHPTVTNPATYLGGSRDFGAFPDPAGPFPHIISRNLTPDSSGLPVGGDTFDKFLQTIRTGIDPDMVHPTCAGPPNGKCIPPPFNGDLLQIMPWPAFQYMTDDDLRAIYTYLSAIPCVEGGPGEPANRCTVNGKTVAVASPKNATVTTRELRLDGSNSTSSDGKPLTFLWSIPQGSPSAGIYGANTATPSVQFSQRGAVYTFLLTVTDSTGKSSTDTVKINY
jgi:hypothetical protein